MDGKYGRLFTVSDVKLMLALARDGITEANVEDLAGIDPDCELAALCSEMGDALTFSADEPLFLLRAQDEAALATLRAYSHNCDLLGASEEHIQAIREARRRFNEWRLRSGGKVKVPD